MEDSFIFDFESSALEVIATVKEITDDINYPVIIKEIFFAVLYSYPNSPMYMYFRKHGVSEQEISDFRDETFKKMGTNLIEYEYTYLRLDLGGYLSNEMPKNIEQVFDLAVDINVVRIFMTALKIAKNQYGKESVGISDLIVAFAELYPDYYDMVVTELMPGRKKKMDEKEHYSFRLPQELSGFLTVMNDNVPKEGSECPILGREEETKELEKVLMKQTKRNAVLVGNPGVGKTALVEKLVWMIETGDCHYNFYGMKVVSLDVNAIIAGTRYRGMAEERFKQLIEFLENNPDCILFVDEIHLLLGAGACSNNDLDLANALKPLLARGATRVIGATTIEEYENYFSRDGALKRRFEKIYVKEPRTSEVIKMIKNQVERLEKTHHVYISDELIKEVVNKAACFNFETCNPDRSLDLLDKVMVSAELEERSEVEMQDVLDNFKIYFRKFDKMNRELKKATAYHEAGHYIVTRFSDELVEYDLLAVSIYPTENYLGVNVYDIDEEATPSGSLEYYIQKIASLLAGRIAEERYSNALTSGASSDLNKATAIASDVVTKYALDTDFSRYRVYSLSKDNVPTYSNVTVDNIEERINSVLEKGEEHAKRILEERKEYLDLLANALVEKGMLTNTEINRIFVKKSW